MKIKILTRSGQVVEIEIKSLPISSKSFVRYCRPAFIVVITNRTETDREKQRQTERNRDIQR